MNKNTNSSLFCNYIIGAWRLPAKACLKLDPTIVSTATAAAEAPETAEPARRGDRLDREDMHRSVTHLGRELLEIPHMVVAYAAPLR